MTAPDRSITSHQSRAASLASELRRQLAHPGIAVSGERNAVAWYMQYGHSLGLARWALEEALEGLPAIKAVAATLTEEEEANGKPPPEFVEGQAVEVIVNAKNLTYHAGVIHSVTWHHKQATWVFSLEKNGKPVSKRYEARDLRSRDDA